VKPEQFFDALADVPNQRSARFDDVEMKDGGNVYLFDGYAAVYGTPADLGDFSEEIQPGAFDQVLKEGRNVPLLHEHHPHQLLATTKSGRMRLEADTRGLRVRAKVVKTDLSSRVKALVDSGDITGMSYGFVAGRGNQKILSRGAKPHRLLTGFRRLLDVSTTWDPAFPTTEAQFRSQALQYADTPEAWQRLLMGAYPQLAELGHDLTDRRDDSEEARSVSEAAVNEDAPPGVSDADRLETAKRRMSFVLLSTGGLDDAS
jgi:uncharacterized protein